MAADETQEDRGDHAIRGAEEEGGVGGQAAGVEGCGLVAKV